MIIKFLGMGIIMLSTSLMGICLAERMSQREHELGNLSDAVEMILNELTFTMAPIKDIICKVTPAVRGSCKEMFELLKKYLDDGTAVSKAWENAVEQKAKLLALKSDDVFCLRSCSSMLDAYEIDEQKRRLGELSQKISGLQKNAQNQKAKNSKMVRMLGIYGGVLICVIIF